MSRTYSQSFLIDLYKRQDEEIGTRLAKVCVGNNLPITYVATALGVTRMSVHSWFRGIKPKADKVDIIEAFISVVSADATEGKLPAKDVSSAKEYLSSLTAIPT